MRRKRIFVVPQKDADVIESTIKSNRIKRNDFISISVPFGRDTDMEITCYKNEGGKTVVDATVIKDGNIVAKSEAEKEFFGIWTVKDDDGNVYRADVIDERDLKKAC